MKRLLAAAAGLITLFHAWVFGNQLLAGQLADAALIVRWLAAGGLVAGMVAVRRSGDPIHRGRKTVSVWLLAAALHGPAMMDGRLSPFDQSSLPEAAGTLLQVVASTLIGLGLALAMVQAREIARPVSSLAFAIRVGAARGPRHSPRFAPRPPPRLQ